MDGSSNFAPPRPPMRGLILVLILVVALLLPGRAQVPTTIKHTVPAPAGGPGSDDQFGYAVALSGSLLAVGAPFEDSAALDAGGVFLYDLASTTPGTPVLVLHGPSPAEGDYFGFAVALSGTRLVVGAMGRDGVEADCGAAYVYDLAGITPTTPVATLIDPNPAPGGQFGFAVGVSGTRAVVGASYAGAANEGVVYAYQLAGATPATATATLTHPSPAAGDQFGYAVAVSGTRVVVGAPFAEEGAALNSGRAFIFDLAGATPGTPMHSLGNPSPADNDEFGFAVAISGLRAVVGAPLKLLNTQKVGAAYAYDLAGPSPAMATTTWRHPNPAAGDSFGTAVAVSGSKVLVGVPSRNTGAAAAGAVCVFDLDGAVPATLNNPTPALGELFGAAVAIDGFTAAVGTPVESATGKGAAYVAGPASNDTDGDGLLDLWEYAHFGTLAGHSALDDADGDGYPELLELALDLHPLIPEVTPYPPVVVENGYLTLTIPKRAGVTYLGQGSGTPAGAGFSAASTTVLINNATTLKFRDNTLLSSGGARFLRVQVTAAP